MTHPTSITAILLAAGASTRLGRPKQLLKLGSASLIRKLSEEALASSADRVIVVVGADADAMRRELTGLDVAIVENKHWKDGLSSSIIAGLKEAAGSDGVLFMLCDQPYVDRKLLNEMIDLFRSTQPPVVACEYAGSLGIPALFSKSLFPELMRLRGDTGAKSIILSHNKNVTRVPFPRGVVDIDTPEDLAVFGQ